MPPALDALVSRRLGVPVRLALTELGEESGARAPLSGTASPEPPELGEESGASAPLSGTACVDLRLTPGERAQWQALTSDPRRRDWLLGRAALKKLLGAGTDTSALRFPHPRLSLTHAGGIAVAVTAGAAQDVAAPVTATGSTATVAGVGVDYEPWVTAPRPATARFFLRPAEQARIAGTDGLRRLWTVKEALYKATPDNEHAVLLDYRVADAAAPWGQATGPRGEPMRYASIAMHRGQLSVAVCLAGERRRAAV